jgi:Asp-tRNA(Asn)/Glu-tRNA(Gln) amidotransferase A subunit family amidase
MELADLTLTEQAEALRSAHCSSRDLIDAHLARMERFGGQLSAYVDVYAAAARALADAADIARRAGMPMAVA